MSNVEVLSANALRRSLRAGEKEVVPRVSDLDALASSTSGKIEIETLEDGREGQIVDNMLKGAVLTVFKQYLTPDQLRGVRRRPSTTASWPTRARTFRPRSWPSSSPACPPCGSRSRAITGGDESPAAVAAAVEFILEGLHLSKRLNKDASGARSTYRSRC